MNLRLASLFQDHAVLQRDRPLPVWGRATPFARVRVSLAGRDAFAPCDEGGRFSLRLPPLPAGGPHTLVATDETSGERVEIRDLLVGEVWLASGQSNMEWTLDASRPLVDADIAAADFPGMRFFKVRTRAHLGCRDDVQGEWRVVDPRSAGGFSAVAFACARRLHRELGVPVGVIVSSWGGSIIQSWLSRSALALNPDTAGALSRFENVAWTEEHWQRMASPGPDGRVTIFPKDPGNTGLARGWHLPEFEDAGWERIPLPGTWQNAGHRHTGVFWFRRSIELPRDWIGKALRLEIGAADKQDVAYVNGVEVGRTGSGQEEQHWATPRAYTVPAALVTGERLVVAVRVYSFAYDGGLIGPASAMRLFPENNPARAERLDGVWRMACEHDLGVSEARHLAGHGERNTPHILFDNMLAPLVPYALRGVWWYQGEGNSDDAAIYGGMLRDLILDWRRAWGDPTLAFHTVQLPGFKPAQEHQPGSSWAVLREAQLSTLALPRTGIAVTIDLGEAGDIHPKNKIPVGDRLADSVLAHTYGRAGQPCGPLFDRAEVEGSALRCHFRHAQGGLSTTDVRPPRLFFIAGASRVFFAAHARIEGATVVASHPGIPHPVAVRYAWADNPEGCNLAGADGRVASPFRSDMW